MYKRQDDEAGRTLVSASSLKDKKANGVPKLEQAKLVGQAIAEKAKAAGIDKVVFDRSGYLYHCLLYTSDAADERSSVDLGGRRIIKKTNKKKHTKKKHNNLTQQSQQPQNQPHQPTPRYR